MCRAALTAVTLAGIFGCTAHRAPDRALVAREIDERVGVDVGAPPATLREWTLPPTSRIEDGLTIDEAVAIALWNNAAFQAALSALGLARADLIEAGMIRNPILSLLLPWGPKQLEFTSTWPVDVLWQRPKRLAEAKINADAVAAQLVSGGLKLIADVKTAFLDAIASERRLAIAVDQADMATRLAELAQGRYRAGDISEFEARLAGTDAQRLEAARLTRSADRDLGLVRLRALLGQSPDAAPLRLTWPANPPATCVAAADMMRTALAARPDVRAAELQVEAAGMRAGLERARIVSLTATLDANAEGAEGFEMGPGFAIELPIISQNQGRRARAASELEQASRRYLAVRAAVGLDVNAALVGLAEAQGVAAVLGPDVAESAAAARRQADRLHAAGEISLVELLGTRQRLLELEMTRADADLGVHRAIVRLEQAVGKSCAPAR